MLKNILITGGAGYVGTMLAYRLVSENKKVIIYDTFWYGDEAVASPFSRDMRPLKNAPTSSFISIAISSTR